MEELNVTNKAELARRFQELHDESRNLLSELEFIIDENRFFERLLYSYAFIPHVESLFDELHKLKNDIKSMKSENDKMIKKVHLHDNHLGGMMECNDNGCALGYIEEHNEIKHEVNIHIGTFKEIKRRVFSYSDIILESKKNI